MIDFIIALNALLQCKGEDYVQGLIDGVLIVAQGGRKE